jgi:hypothetical protein
VTTSGRPTQSAAIAPDEAPAPGTIAPEDSFLVQLRGGSRLADRAVSGRIEHLHSGVSEPFGSLTELFAFLGRHFGRSGTGTDDGEASAAQAEPGRSADVSTHGFAAHPATEK